MKLVRVILYYYYETSFFGFVDDEHKIIHYGGCIISRESLTIFLLLLWILPTRIPIIV